MNFWPSNFRNMNFQLIGPIFNKIDFYFILNSEKVLDLKNIFIQEELNMFLSNIKQQTD